MLAGAGGHCPFCSLARGWVWGCPWVIRGEGIPPRRAPLGTGFRRYDGGGVGDWRELQVAEGGPFDRLRANGLARCACDGMGLAVGAPHVAVAPLDSCLRRNDEKGGRNDEKGGRNDEKVGGGGRRAGGAAVCGVSGGSFDRLRANGFARHVRRGGVGGGGAPPGAPGYRLPPV